MTTKTSPATGKTYTITDICRVWGIPRSNIYFFRTRQEAGREPVRRRGPQGTCPDDEMVKRIREVLEASPFHSEGYRKVWARLRAKGTRRSGSAL